jgi:hypothetical protein
MVSSVHTTQELKQEAMAVKQKKTMGIKQETEQPMVLGIGGGEGWGR